MSFITGFLVGRLVAERQGITDDAALNRLALLGGVMGGTPTGLVMTTLLAKREAEAIQPVTPTTPEPARVEMPDVIKDSFSEAKKRLEALSLVVEQEDIYSMTTPKGHVNSQNPLPKTIIAQGSTVLLSVSLGAEVATPEDNCPIPSKTPAVVGTNDGGNGGKKG